MDKKVCLAKCESYETADVERAVAAIFEQYGGVQELLKKGNKVLIKPNLLMAREPSTATTTNPELVIAVARLLTQAGAQVTVADSPGGPYNAAAMSKVYRVCEMTEVEKRSTAKLNRDFTYTKTEFEGREFELITPVLEADVIIDIAKMKTHLLTYFTGATKNLFGTIAGLHKTKWHSKLPGRQEFSKMLVDLCRCVNPDFCIIDGVEGMDGKGPSGGRVRKVGVLVASKNTFAADLAASNICGLSPELQPIHQHAVKLGLVPKSASQLEMCGDEFPPLKEPFVPPVSKKDSWAFLNYTPEFLRMQLQRILVPYPKMTDRCIGCGDCARACPGNAIVVVNGKARLVHKKTCIKCYCCHELCPVKAIKL